MPDMTEIKCEYCNEPYVAYKKGRTHCRKPNCRTKEIKKQLNDLQYFVELFCVHKIEATIEFRFAGNDKLSKDAKINSVSRVNDGLKEENKNMIAGINLNELIDYFRPILWKGVKGNFIIKILKDGTIDPTVLNETFTEIADPVIIGNNLIINGSVKI